MIILVCLSVCLSVCVCLSVRFFTFAARTVDLELYNPTTVKITAEQHSVMFVDLNSIDTDGLPRISHL